MIGFPLFVLEFGFIGSRSFTPLNSTELGQAVGKILVCSLRIMCEVVVQFQECQVLKRQQWLCGSWPQLQTGVPRQVQSLQGCDEGKDWRDLRELVEAPL